MSIGAGEGEQKQDKLKRQLEYYFSDRNLWKDDWLLQQLGEDGTGWLPISVLLKFDRIQVNLP